MKRASALLRKKSSLAIAGGTSFVAAPRVDHLVDLTRIGLNYIKEGKKDITIGATITASEIIESEVLGGVASGILCSTCRSTADTQLENVITVGGNIACRYNWTCMPPALMVLDAKLRIVGGRKDRILPVEEFFNTKLKPGELIKEVIISKSSTSGKGVFIKFTRTSFDYAIITLAVYAERQGNTVSTLRVAVSGATHPMRLKSLEEALQGKEVNERSIEEAAVRAAAQVPILKSYLFSEEYRREVQGVLLKRALKKVLMEG